MPPLRVSIQTRVIERRCRRTALLILALLLIFPGSADGQIRPGSDFSAYWEYDGRPTLLLGAWDHGHNPFLDHSTMDGGGYEDVSSKAEIVAALDKLADAGGNLVRCVLDPGVGAGRQGFDFCARRGSRYDLERMVGPYWDRLEFFLSETKKRDIIVGLEVWDRFDWYDGGHEGWPNSPFNPKNNVNYSTASSGLLSTYAGNGNEVRNPFGQTTPGQTAYREADPERRAQFDLVRKYQEKFVDRLLDVTLNYDHVLYSANNEVRNQEAAWGAYWIDYIRSVARDRGKEVVCTDMFWELLDLPGKTRFDHLLANPQFYDYFDISQTSAQRNASHDAPRAIGRTHWEMVSYAVGRARQVDRLLHMNKIYGSDQRAGTWMGSAEGAVEEFWRSLIAGVAGVRFHRPESGLGLSDRALNSIRAAREVEQRVRFWEVDADQSLLTDADENEAYLAADPGRKYILYFTNGGAVGLDLTEADGISFETRWINISTGQASEAASIEGGRVAEMAAPAPGPWAVTVVRSSR